MHSRRLAVAFAAVLLAGIASSLTTAAPPRPGTEGNGLSENESATLWSRDNDSRYISNAAYRDAYGESRTMVHQVANGTDLSFKRPPATASVWTRHDFADFSPGDRTTSISPEDATLRDSKFVRDAHTTIFAASPSTKAHRSANETTWYVAPDGRLLGTVDYRIRTPEDIERTDRRTSWSVHSHDIDEVRLLQDDTVLTRTDGSHRPNLSYSLDTSGGNLTLEADIEVTLEKTVRDAYFVNVTGPNGTNRTEKRWRTDVQLVNDSVTVSDTIDVEVYDLDVSLSRAEYPDGTSGVAVFQNRPWQGYSLTSSRSTDVRGVWRFYTARDTDWDTLTQSRASGETHVESDAIPVYVHAYPSELGPRTEPVHTGPELVHVWGTEHTSPEGSVGKNVDIEVVSGPYESSYGVAVRTSSLDAVNLTVRGIVRGVNATVATSPNGSPRELRESELSMDIVSRDESGMTLRVTLRDASTGDPIVLDEAGGSRNVPIAREERSGYVTIDSERIETNSSGMATVHVDSAGIYTARYHPGSWLSHDPAYVGDTDSVRWHPLTTAEGWLSLFVSIVQWFLPLAAALYAGRRFGWVFHPRREL